MQDEPEGEIPHAGIDHQHGRRRKESLEQIRALVQASEEVRLHSALRAARRNKPDGGSAIVQQAVSREFPSARRVHRPANDIRENAFGERSAAEAPGIPKKAECSR